MEPQLATLVRTPPEGEQWLHEIKLDGYRLLARVESGQARLLTRHGNDWSDRMPSLARVLASLPLERALLDGEVAVLARDGTTSFQLLQSSLNARADERCVYFAFDILHWDDVDLRGVTLQHRKEALRELLRDAGTAGGRCRLAGHLRGRGGEIFARACELGAEGIICKRADRPFRPGRGRDWLKVKCTSRQELVVGGFTEPRGGRAHFGALLLGTHEEGRLVYRGRVGTGFTDRDLAALHARLLPLERPDPPFHHPPRGPSARGVHWVEPAMVAEVEYASITRDGILRHATFRGLREDKAPREVRLERAIPVPEAEGRPVEAHPSGPSGALPRRGGGTAVIAGVRLTHPDRVLYEEEGLTKRHLAEYYMSVADLMLPHVARRPLTLLRCPEGRQAECFYQKHFTPGMPEAIHPVPITDDGVEQHTFITDAAGLVSLVQMGVLEIHTWGAHVDDPERPDQLVFDLDPAPDVAWPMVIAGALRLRDLLGVLRLESFVKTTGGKGLHVVVPVERGLEWDEAKRFCKGVAEAVVRMEPSRYVSTMGKAERRGRIYVDYLRNGRGATAICAYSTRARAGAPVSAPLAWDELAPSTGGGHYGVRSMAPRVEGGRRDPWGGFADVAQGVSLEVLRTLERELAKRR